MMKLGFTGDLMLCDQPLLCGMGVFSKYKTDFSPIFKNFSQWIAERNIDYLIGNFESVLMNNDQNNSSNTIAMATNVKAIDALVTTGFTTLSLANNHTMEYGPQVFEQMMCTIQSKGLSYFGCKENPVIFLEKNNVKVGVIAFSNIPAFYNHSPLYFYVNSNDRNSRNQLAMRVKDAKAKCDALVAFPHWGTEFMTSPNNAQRDLAELLVDNGTDLIVGTHPHVVQDACYMGKVPVFFSTGSLISDYPIDHLRKSLYIEAIWNGEGFAVEAHHFEVDSKYVIMADKISNLSMAPYPQVCQDERQYLIEGLRLRKDIRNRMILHLLKNSHRLLRNPETVQWIVKRALYLFKNRKLISNNPEEIYRGPIH